MEAGKQRGRSTTARPPWAGLNRLGCTTAGTVRRTGVRISRRLTARPQRIGQRSTARPGLSDQRPSGPTMGALHKAPPPHTHTPANPDGCTAGRSHLRPSGLRLHCMKTRFPSTRTLGSSMLFDPRRGLRARRRYTTRSNAPVHGPAVPVRAAVPAWACPLLRGAVAVEVVGIVQHRVRRAHTCTCRVRRAHEEGRWCQWRQANSAAGRRPRGHRGQG